MARSFRYQWEKEVMAATSLPAMTRFVLLAVATYMDGAGRGAFPSQETLALDTGLTARTVRKHLAIAERAGWLLKVRQGRHVGRGASYSNMYDASLPPVDNPPQEEESSAAGGTDCSQEESCAAAGGTGVPPINKDQQKRSADDGFCVKCENTGLVGGDRDDDGLLAPLSRCPNCHRGARSA